MRSFAVNAALFPKDFRDDENHNGAEKAATEEEIQEGPTGRGYGE